MNRLFGSKKEAPDLDAVLAASEERVAASEKKIREIDEELGRIKVQLGRPGLKDSLQNKARRLLKQKKMLTMQLEQQSGIAMNLGQVAMSTSTIEASMASIKALKSSANALQATQRSVKLRDVERLQDRMADLLEYNTEIQETLGRSLNYDVPDDIDDAELEAELAILETEIEPDATYLDLPSIPELTHKEPFERQKEGVI